YCQEEVEAQYAEWLESRIGSHEEAQNESNDDAGTPFPRAVVLAHLARSREELMKLADVRRQTSADEYCAALTRATARPEELENDYAATAQPDSRKLEDSLTVVDRMVYETIRNTVSDDDLKSIIAEIAEKLTSYKR